MKVFDDDVLARQLLIPAGDFGLHGHFDPLVTPLLVLPSRRETAIFLANAVLFIPAEYMLFTSATQRPTVRFGWLDV